MSTFDTLCDLEDGRINKPQALINCLHYLAMWADDPELVEMESFQAMVQILKTMEPEYAEYMFGIQSLDKSKR